MPPRNYQKDIFNYILLFLFILLIYSLSIHEIVDSDVFYHVKMGGHILKNKEIPSRDIFSYTIEGKPWLNNQWLAQVIFYALYSLFNFNGLILFKATIICLAFLIMFFTFFKRNTYSWLYFFIATLAVIAACGRFLERPENFTLLFIAAYLYIFIKRPRLIFLIPVIQIFWANMHGGFILGLVLTGLFTAGEILEAKVAYFKREASENNNGRLRRSFILSAAVFLACFINPFGYRLILNTFQFVNNKLMQKVILEWLPTFSDPSQYRFDTMAAFISLVIISMVTLLLNIRKVKPFSALCLVVFLYLGISARRNIALFAIVSAIFIGESATQIIDTHFISLQRILSKSRYIISACLVFLLCLLISSVAANAYYTYMEVPQSFGFGISDALQPVGASDFIKENNIRGNLFNDYDFGAYLIYALYPKQRVFIDGRIDTYGDDFYLNEYGAFFSNNKEILKRAIDKYGIDIFVLKMGKENALESYLLENEDYRLVYFDRSSLVILKNSPGNKNLIAEYAIDTSDIKKLEGYTLKVEARQERSYGFDSLSRLFEAYTKNRRLPLAEYELGIFYGRIGALELARQQFEKGIALFPSYKIIRYELGNLYFRKGKLDEAMDAYSQVLRYDKRDYKVFKVLGDIYLAKNDFVNAALEYEKSIKIKPSYDIGVYKTLGTIYKFYLKDDEKAQRYFLRYEQLTKDIKERQQ